MPGFEYKTEVLTSRVGRDKLRLDDLDDRLKKYGEGWAEVVSLNLDADLKGSRDGPSPRLQANGRVARCPGHSINGRRSPRRELAAIVRLLGPQAPKGPRAQL